MENGRTIEVEGAGGARATLRELAGEDSELDVFERHPQLLSIWSGTLREMAREGFVEFRPGEGGRFLVEMSGRVVGVSGFFSEPGDSAADLRLRWHGLVPEARGLGLSGPTMREVARIGRERRPKAARLVESMPAGEAGAAIARHFAKLGFREFGPPEPGGSCGFDWQSWAVDLDELLAPRPPRRAAPGR